MRRSMGRHVGALAALAFFTGCEAGTVRENDVSRDDIKGAPTSTERPEAGAMTGAGVAATCVGASRVPPGSGVVDVTSFGARPDDGVDDTAAIQAALDANPNADRVIYLPDGTYDLSSTLSWSLGAPGTGDDYKRTILQGQSRERTVLRLHDATPGFSNPAAPKPVVFTGDGVAQKFRNGIRMLTVDTGRNNPGAIGIQFMANNQGGMNEVTIRSGDGQGAIGLDTTQTTENGPALVRRVAVYGFDTGIKTRWQVNSLTFEHIVLEGQRSYGFWNHGQQINVRDLASTNSNKVPAIYQELNSTASMVVLDAKLVGTGPTDAASRAIWNQRALHVLNLSTSGFARAIDHDDKGFGSPDVVGPDVVEWDSAATTPSALPGAGPPPARLTVLETPEAPCDDSSTWANVEDFGAVGGDDVDDTAAVQAAIDSGADTVFFPGGKTFTLSSLVHVRGAVTRITGFEGRIQGIGSLDVAEGAPSVVRIEHLDMEYSGVSVRNSSRRTLVLSALTLGGGGYEDQGDGDLFLEDVVGGNFLFRGGRVFARQLNVENSGTKISNDGARLWILGLKTEKAGTAIVTTGGGVTELAGGLLYTNQPPGSLPAFVSVDSDLTIMGLSERNFIGSPIQVLVAETHAGSTLQYLASMRTGRGSFWYSSSSP